MKIERFLRESPVFAVAQAHARICGEADRRLAAEGLNSLQGLVLLAIFFEKEGPPRPSELARAFGVARANVSHALSHLERLRLVRRGLNPADSRSYLLELRPEGRRAAQRVVRVFHRSQEAFERQAGARPLRACLDVLASLRHE